MTDLSQLSTEDLQAISGGDMSKVSEAGLRALSGAPAAAPAEKPFQDPSLGRYLLGAGEAAGGAVANIPHGIGHALVDIYNKITGKYGDEAKDPNWLNAIHVHEGEAAKDFGQATANDIEGTLDSLGIGDATTRGVKSATTAAQNFAQNNPVTTHVVAPIAGDVLTLAGARGLPSQLAGIPGKVANAARGVRTAMSGEGFDIPEEPTAADAGLKAPSNPPLKPHQQVGNTIGGAEASVPTGTPLNPENLKAARAAPGSVMGRVAAATPDGPVDQQTLDEVANAGGSGVPVSGKGSIDNIQSMRDNLTTILKSDSLTGRQKVDWLQALRTKGYKNAASQDPGSAELGDAQLDAANALEGHIERSLPKNADVDIDQFRAARTALAKNHTVESVLKGGNIDMGALGRMYQRNPNLLTGGLQLLGKYASENPELVGMGNRFQDSLSSAASGFELTKPATWLKPVTAVTDRVMANREAASGVEAAQRAFPTPSPSRFEPIDRTPQPPPGMTASTPEAPPAKPAGNPGDIPLADLLSHGVEQSPPAGLTAGPMGAPPAEGLPFTRNAAHEAGDLQLAPEGKEPSLGDLLSDLRDYAAVKSSNVPTGTMARSGGTQANMRLGDMLDIPGTRPQVQLGKPPGQAFEPGQRGLFNGGAVENNGSSPGAAGADSLEAQSRLAQEKATGSQPFTIDPEGNAQPLLHTVDAVDRAAPKGHLKVQIDPSTGKLSIMDRGGMTLSAAKGLLNRYLSLHSTRLGDELGS